MRLVPYGMGDDREAFSEAFCALGPCGIGSAAEGGLSPTICRLLLNAPYPPRRQFWLMYDDGGVPAGRVCANVSVQNDKLGYFGLLEVRPDRSQVAMGRALLDAAEAWLAARGVREMIGPVTFTTWFPYRFRLRDGERRRFSWEPSNPPEYVEIVETAGFQLLETYSSTAFGDLTRAAESLEPAVHRAQDSGYSFHPFAEGPIEPHIATLYRLSTSAFSENYLFEPLPEPLFAEVYLSLAAKGSERLAWFVKDPRKQPVGFLYAFIDQVRHQGVLERLLVLKSAGVEPEVRGHGLSNALVYLALRASLARGVEYAVSALVRIGHQSESYARRGRRLWCHDYGLWKKRIASS